MEALVLKKGPAELVLSALWIVVALIWIVGTFDGNVVLHLCWWLVLVLFSLRLAIDLWRPQLAYRHGRLCIQPYKSLVRRKCLPVDDILEVRETTRKAGGVLRIIDLPSFIFVLSEGHEVEYFPALASGKRLNAIRYFLERVPNLPNIEKATKEQEI